MHNTSLIFQREPCGFLCMDNRRIVDRKKAVFLADEHADFCAAQNYGFSPLLF